MNPFSPTLMVMMSVIATGSKLEHGAQTDFISALYICISEPSEWLDVFQAGRPRRVLGKLFTESQGARRL